LFRSVSFFGKHLFKNRKTITAAIIIANAKAAGIRFQARAFRTPIPMNAIGNHE